MGLSTLGRPRGTTLKSRRRRTTANYLADRHNNAHTARRLAGEYAHPRACRANPVDAHPFEAVRHSARVVARRSGRVVLRSQRTNRKCPAGTPWTMWGCRGTRHTLPRHTHCIRLRQSRTARTNTVCTVVRPAHTPRRGRPSTLRSPRLTTRTPPAPPRACPARGTASAHRSLVARCPKDAAAVGLHVAHLSLTNAERTRYDSAHTTPVHARQPRSRDDYTARLRCVQGWRGRFRLHTSTRTVAELGRCQRRPFPRSQRACGHLPDGRCGLRAPRRSRRVRP